MLNKSYIYRFKSPKVILYHINIQILSNKVKYFTYCVYFKYLDLKKKIKFKRV